jgi:hypothetical protein
MHLMPPCPALPGTAPDDMCYAGYEWLLSIAMWNLHGRGRGAEDRPQTGARSRAPVWSAFLFATLMPICKVD